MNMPIPRSLIRPIRSGYDVVRILAAFVLLTAAGLKGWQLATEPVIGHSILDSRWLLMAVVEFELFFGLSLLVCIWTKPIWAGALACFSVFACISLYKAVLGYASCGCFGHVQVNPWYTALLDSAVVVSLLRWRPTGSQPTVPIWLNRLTIRVIAVFVIWFLVGIPAALVMWRPPITLLESDTSVVDGRKFVVLKPEKWSGKRFPLLDFIDIGERLRKGRWLVLLCRCDCPKCQQVVEDLPELRTHLVFNKLP